jgi:hypothetical protein
MKLLYRISEWHALAKLRMHTEYSLELMEESTKEIGELLRQFRWLTCAQFSTIELPREADARMKRKKDSATDVSHPDHNAALPQARLNATPSSVPLPTITSGAGDQNILVGQEPNSKSAI